MPTYVTPTCFIPLCFMPLYVTPTWFIPLCVMPACVMPTCVTRDLLHTSLRYSSLRYDYSQNQLVAIQLWHEAFIIAMILFQLLSIEVSHRYTSIHTFCDGICPHFFTSFLEECSEKTDKRRSFKYKSYFLCCFFFPQNRINKPFLLFICHQVFCKF